MLSQQSMGITRKRAMELLGQHIQNPNSVKHSLATEAVMRRLALELGEDVEIWGMTGLLHDLDIESTANDLENHTLKTAEILKAEGVHPDLIEAIIMHNEVASKRKRAEKYHIALAAGETITGLIVATALVYPDKKIKSVKPKSVTKRMKEKAFAAGVNREIILECEQLGYSVADFAKVCLEAMCEIDQELGL